LLAENYLEILVNGEKASWMNVGVPSKETVDFLDGLIQMLKSKNESIVKLMGFNYEKGKEVSLFKSFGYTKSREQAISDIIDNAVKNVNDESIVLFASKSQQSSEDHWTDVEKSIPFNYYDNLWIHRWISLFVLGKIDGLKTYADRLDKQSLANLIFYTSEWVPSYLKKLSGVYLRGPNLSRAYLWEADLSGANLANVDEMQGIFLEEANLSGADLHSTFLPGASLSGANLSGANLSGAFLRRANLTNANLQAANLSGAHLRVAYIDEAHLGGANLTGADLTEAHLTKANLSGAFLRRANLTEAHLTKANLSGADLHSTFLPGANFSGANLSGANLYGAKLQEANLEGAISQMLISRELIYQKTKLKSEVPSSRLILDKYRS
jgi:uncharacterized protein YjbI with pentapeptide repeats